MSKSGQADAIELGAVGGEGCGKNNVMPEEGHDSTGDRITSFSMRRVEQEDGFDSDTQGDSLQNTKEYVSSRPPNIPLHIDRAHK